MNHSQGVVLGMAILVGQVVTDPTVVDIGMLGQLTALAAAIGTASFGIAALVRALADAYIKIRSPQPPAAPQKAVV